MDPDLTRKGRRFIEEDCEEAFKEIDHEKLKALESEISQADNGRLASQLLHVLETHCPNISPHTMPDGTKIDYPIVDLQALLLYEALEIDRDFVGFSQYDPIRSMETGSVKLLEAYLVHQDLIKIDSCELY